jgi:sporulation protein YlmC with PRC-barrel domain
MRPTLLTATAASVLLLCQAGAMAQTKTPATQPGSAPSINETQSTTPNPSTHGLRAQVRDMLQKEGFTDVRVVPSSFMVRAKDKNGNPVIMSISPDSFTEVSEVSSAGSDNIAGPMDSNANAPGSQFVSIANSGALSSNVIGLDVYNNDNKDIGQIKDIAMNQRGRTEAYIVSVGGFLGMGERYVAVNPTDIKVSYIGSDKKWHATMNATAEQFKSAPEFRYNGRWNASKS